MQVKQELQNTKRRKIGIGQIFTTEEDGSFRRQQEQEPMLIYMPSLYSYELSPTT